MEPATGAGGGSRGRALALMFAAAVGFAGMNAIVKVVTAHGVSFLEAAAVRALLGAALLAAWAHARGVSLAVHNRGIMALRVLAGTGAMATTFWSLAHVPLADATALFNTMPLFVALLGWAVLGERVSGLLWASLVLALAGVVLVMHPSGAIEPSRLVPLAAAALSAVAMLSLRRLGATEAPEAVVVHFSLWAGLALGAAAIPTLRMPSLEDAAWMSAAGVVATLSQLWMTKAYALERAARVGGAGYVTVVASAGLGVVAFGETLPWSSAIGIAVVLAAGALLAYETRRSDVSPGRGAARAP